MKAITFHSAPHSAPAFAAARMLAPLCLAMLSATGAGAQVPKVPSAVPDLATMGGSNAAGVLTYCAKNKLIDSAQSNSVYSALTKKPDVSTDSSSYTSGSSGNILTGDGKSFSLDKAPKQVRQKACDMVLKQSRSLL
ncbi:DUF2501 domain-containing protein [Novosphingobium sp. BL-8A]|uniref:DUF2501 domain-containing protein n=1 Tax=Novosphingobium sp. BL-8A TaxID=3127639 RepID=UPI003756F572